MELEIKMSLQEKKKNFWSRDFLGCVGSPRDFFGVFIFTLIRSSPSLEIRSTPAGVQRLHALATRRHDVIFQQKRLKLNKTINESQEIVVIY